MRLLGFLVVVFSVFVLFSCSSSSKKGVPNVGFIEAFEDETIATARQGFLDALDTAGFSPSKGTLNFIYKNAQGDQTILNQIVSYMKTAKVDLVATSTTVATLAEVQRNKETPIFMTVTATPQILGIADAKGNGPANLFGIAENLQYIDTSFMIIKHLVKPKTSEKLRIGMIYNQSEPQSVDAFKRLKSLSDKNQTALVALPLTTSADAQLVIRSLLDKKIDAFFANPDNTVFASFETILKNCDQANVPVFTSEIGLVKRGAVAAYGADIYQWGYETGQQAAQYLKTKSTKELKIKLLDKRRWVYQPKAAEKYGYHVPSYFEAVN